MAGKPPTSVSIPLNPAGAGRLGLCFCPGKQVQRGRTRWSRNMQADLTRLKATYTVTTMVCLLDAYELRSFHISGYKDQVASLALGFAGRKIQYELPSRQTK